MKIGYLCWVGAFTGALLLSGCNSIDSRIAQHSVTWDALSKTDQARIKKGDVRPGDREEMALIAYGDPDRKAVSTIANHGQGMLWFYERLVSNEAYESSFSQSSLPPADINYTPVVANRETTPEQAAQLNQQARESGASSGVANLSGPVASGRIGVEITRLIVISDGVVVSNSRSPTVIRTR